MPAGCRVDTVHAIEISTLEELPFRVKNVGAVPIYYKVEPLGSMVSPTNKTGEIKSKEEFTVTQPTWVIAKEPGAQLDFQAQAKTVPSWARPREAAEFYVTQVPFNVKNDGVTDDTAALQTAVNAGKESKVIIPPGLGCVVSSPVVLQQQAMVSGLNRETSVILTEGEIAAFQTKGGNRIEKLEFQCKAKQEAAGSAIDFSKGPPNSIWIDDICIGSNFFNGINAVGEVEGGGVHLSRIEVSARATRAKSVKGAAIVLGSSAVRLIGVWMDDVYIAINASTESTTGIEINNTDSLHAHRVLVQNAKKGIVIGNSDASTLRTTNLFAHDLQADGCGTGFELASIQEGARLEGCTAEAGSNGFVLGAEISGLTFSGCAAFKNAGEGMLVKSTLPGASGFSNSIIGCQFHTNGTNEEAGRAGLYFEEKSGGFVVMGNTFGNPKPAEEKQKVGVRLGKKTENILFVGNRFLKNVTEPMKKDGEEVNINAKAAPTFAELESAGMNVKV